MTHYIVMGCGWNQDKQTERGWRRDPSVPQRVDEPLFVGHTKDDAHVFLASQREADQRQCETGNLTGWTYYVVREVEGN